ncbi:MAG TPA: hypothetical protein VM093_03310 [Aeromicrobium sp.]|nr:hypothetical protein [Aeromicrobium sp.]
MNDQPGDSRTADAVVAWLLYALQVAGELFLGMFWVMSVMMTDSCGSVVDEPRVCDGQYFATWFFAYAAALAVGLLATPVAIVVAGRMGKPRWPWPVLVIVLLAAATIGYGFAFSR